MKLLLLPHFWGLLKFGGKGCFFLMGKFILRDNVFKKLFMSSPYTVHLKCI